MPRTYGHLAWDGAQGCYTGTHPQVGTFTVTPERVAAAYAADGRLTYGDTAHYFLDLDTYVKKAVLKVSHWAPLVGTPGVTLVAPPPRPVGVAVPWCTEAGDWLPVFAGE